MHSNFRKVAVHGDGHFIIFEIIPCLGSIIMQDAFLFRDLLNQLDALCSGHETRDQVAQWAMSIIYNDNIRIPDKVVWEILLGLGVAVLPSTDR